MKPELEKRIAWSSHLIHCITLLVVSCDVLDGQPNQRVLDGEMKRLEKWCVFKVKKADVFTENEENKLWDC